MSAQSCDLGAEDVQLLDLRPNSMISPVGGVRHGYQPQASRIGFSAALMPRMSKVDCLGVSL